MDMAMEVGTHSRWASELLGRCGHQVRVADARQLALITNSNATHADQYVSSTYMGSPLDKSDIHLGFNIERRFGR